MYRVKQINFLSRDTDGDFDSSKEVIWAVKFHILLRITGFLSLNQLRDVQLNFCFHFDPSPASQVFETICDKIVYDVNRLRGSIRVGSLNDIGKLIFDQCTNKFNKISM